MVVSFADSGDRPFCPNAEFVSSLLNTVASASWARVWSTLGSGWNSVKMLSLRFVESTQIRTLPLAFGTITIPVHHSVGSSTLEIICICSIRKSSSLTFVRRGTGTLLGVLSANGSASGFSFDIIRASKFSKSGEKSWKFFLEV